MNPMNISDSVSEETLEKYAKSLCRDPLLMVEEAQTLHSFVKGYHTVRDLPYEVAIRQICGHGACLFASLAASLHYLTYGVHPSSQNQEFLYLKNFMRQTAVDSLSDDDIDLPRILVMTGDQVISSSVLVEQAAQGMNVSREKYLQNMRQHYTWGGGPEIVALCNYLQRPIFTYDVVAVNGTSVRSPNGETNDSKSGPVRTFFCDISRRIQLRHSNLTQGPKTIQAVQSIANPSLDRSKGSSTEHMNGQMTSFTLRLLCAFGWPVFIDNEPLHLLHTWSNFPSLRTRNNFERNNHFVPVFPTFSS